MDILRFITAGSVDDGKSTLIGRLLHDTQAIFTDQLEAIQKQSKNTKGNGPDLALLTDGLRAEREQGITIDVAYKYFSTTKRKFIIADTPGHIQYTRNMITGASNADLAIILVDARQGVVEQTRRHTLIVSLLGIPNIVVAINKMDLVDYSQEVYDKIVNDYNTLLQKTPAGQIHYVPISALAGDNVVDTSANISWYKGPSLLTLLETIEARPQENTAPRFQVQYVIRPQTEDLHDYRGYAGRVLSGSFKKGDEVTVLPTGITSRISRIEKNLQDTDIASQQESVVLHLEDDIDISRGDTFVAGNTKPTVEQELDVLLCWMDDKPLITSNKYLLQHNSRLVRAKVKEIKYRINVNEYTQEAFPAEIKTNDIVLATIKTASPLVFDAYKNIRTNGGAILIDETSHSTSAACIIQ